MLKIECCHGLEKEEIIKLAMVHVFFLNFVVCQQTIFGSIYGEIVFPGIIYKLYLPGK